MLSKLSFALLATPSLARNRTSKTTQHDVLMLLLCVYIYIYIYMCVCVCLCLCVCVRGCVGGCSLGRCVGSTSRMSRMPEYSLSRLRFTLIPGVGVGEWGSKA